MYRGAIALAAMMALTLSCQTLISSSAQAEEPISRTNRLALANTGISLFSAAGNSNFPKNNAALKPEQLETERHTIENPAPADNQQRNAEDIAAFRANGSICDGKEIRARKGINRISLKENNYLISSKKDTIAIFQEGFMKVDAKSVVFVMSKNDCTAIYDFHDSHAKAVLVNCGGKSFAMLPGQEIVITKQQNNFNLVNPLGKLGYRRLDSKQLGDTSIHFADFSISSAFIYIDPLLQMMRSTDREHISAINRIMKNAAILSRLTSAKGNYSTSADTLELSSIRKNTSYSIGNSSPALLLGKFQGTKLSHFK